MMLATKLMTQRFVKAFFFGGGGENKEEVLVHRVFVAFFFSVVVHFDKRINIITMTQT
jgi:hypothetical protein